MSEYIQQVEQQVVAVEKLWGSIHCPDSFQTWSQAIERLARFVDQYFDEDQDLGPGLARAMWALAEDHPILDGLMRSRAVYEPKPRVQLAVIS